MQILIRAPEFLKEKLKKKAADLGITMNALILQILWNWADENKEKPPVGNGQA